MDSGSPFIHWLLANQQLFLYSSVLLCIPSTLLYCAEIFTIIRHRKFHNSFYALFVARSVTNLLYVADSFVFRRIPSLMPELTYAATMPNWPNWCLLMFMFLASYTLLANDIGTALLLFNRLTAIASPISYKNIWRKILPLTIFAIFAIPLVCLNVFSTKGVVATQRDENGKIMLVIIFTENEQNDANSCWNITGVGMIVISSILFLIICTVFSIATLIYYKRQSGKHHSNVQSTHAEVERKLMVYAFATFLAQVLDAITVICLYLSTVNNISFWQTIITTQYELNMDLGMVILPSWLLLWASPSFRQKLTADFVPQIMRKKISKKVTHTEGLQITVKKITKESKMIPVGNVVNS